MHRQRFIYVIFNLQAIIDGEKKDGHSDPYDVICGIRLPRGLDPHSVPSEELSASLGLYFFPQTTTYLSL
jgi:hypothetical protein